MVQDARKLTPLALGPRGAGGSLAPDLAGGGPRTCAPDPTLPALSHTAIILNSAILVLREGLEAILVPRRDHRELPGGTGGPPSPDSGGGGPGAVLATVVTWFIVGGGDRRHRLPPALAVQARYRLCWR